MRAKKHGDIAFGKYFFPDEEKCEILERKDGVREK